MSAKEGPEFVAEAESYSTVDRNGFVKLRIGEVKYCRKSNCLPTVYVVIGR